METSIHANATITTSPAERPAERIHYKYMARLVASGFTAGEIANLTGFSPCQVSKIIHSPLFKKEVARIESRIEDSIVELRSELNALALKAICNLYEDLHIADGLESPRDLTNFERKLRQEASKDILDRVGLSSKREFPVGAIHLHKHDTTINNMSVSELRNDVMELLKE